jgi:hypothetical protein
MITDNEQLNFNGREMYGIQSWNQYEFDRPVATCWSAPYRTVDDNFFPADKIISLFLYGIPGTAWCHYYLNNVKCFVVHNMDQSLLKWVTTYVNCSRIKKLIIKDTCKEITTLISLFAYVTNMSSLRINFDLLIGSKHAFMRTDNSLKHLDISPTEHAFNEEEISVIATLFPYLEHIHINTSNLYNVPKRKTYLSHLRSLRLGWSEIFHHWFNDYQKKQWEYEFRQKTERLFRSWSSRIIIWIDQAVYENPFWHTFPKQSSRSNAILPMPTTASSSSAISANKKKKKGKFSFLKCFK